MYLEILFKTGEYLSSLVLSFGASATQTAEAEGLSPLCVFMSFQNVS